MRPRSFSTRWPTDAVVQRRLENVKLDPYSWVSGLAEWKIDPARALARDSVR